MAQGTRQPSACCGTLAASSCFVVAQPPCGPGVTSGAPPRSAPACPTISTTTTSPPDTGGVPPKRRDAHGSLSSPERSAQTQTCWRPPCLCEGRVLPNLGLSLS